MCLSVLQFDVICDSLNYVIFINIVFYTILFYHIFFYWTRKQKQKKTIEKTINVVALTNRDSIYPILIGQYCKLIMSIPRASSCLSTM